MKKIPSLFFVFLLTVNTLPLVPKATSREKGRSQTTGCNGYCFYEEVLDHAFPLKRPGEQRAPRTLTFRVLPTVNAEWQVVIRESDSGRFQIISYNVDKRQTNIGSLIGRMASEGKLQDLSSVLREIHITEKTIDSPSAPLQEVIKQFFEMTIPANLDKNIFVDGATYKLWEETASNEIHVSISGAEPNETSRLKPLQLWMIRVTSLIAASPGHESTLPLTRPGAGSSLY